MEAVTMLKPLSDSAAIYDAVIVGTGAAGLYTALKLPGSMKILIISKAEIEKSNSALAQGGICVLKEQADFESFYEDTVKAGHYENNPESVEVMIKSSSHVIADLIGYKVDFDRDETGAYNYTKEGAHSNTRILHHKDCTGKEITDKLIAQVSKRAHITMLPHTKMIDLICHNNVCRGIVIENEKAEYRVVLSRNTVLATGGIGGLFQHSTNYPHISGDSFALALKYKIEVENLNYIQIHPTAFYDEKAERRFLISEAVRGEGGILLNHKGERFINELLPRDVVTQAICRQLEQSELPYVFLSLRDMESEQIKTRFPNIYKHCLAHGYDLSKEPIPVTPSQHYIMGGIKTGLNGETSCRHLYAVGESACNGVHGANRLASNSLLESLVFADRAAKKISRMPVLEYDEKPLERYLFQIRDTDREARFRKQIMDEIKRKDKEFYVKWCNNGTKC